MKNKCKFVGIMFLCILIVCTLAVMAYEHTAGMKGAAGGVSNSSGNTKNTDEAAYSRDILLSYVHCHFKHSGWCGRRET